MFSVYLAGYMNEKKLKDCLVWRKKIISHYNNWKGIEKYPICWLDPFNGELKEMHMEGLKGNIPENSILHRDYKAVVSADLVVANLNTFNAKRPLVGTICEIAWAWEKHTPIVVISKEKHFTEHPFIKNFASWIVSDVEELLKKKVINHFFKGLSDALY